LGRCGGRRRTGEKERDNPVGRTVHATANCTKYGAAALAEEAAAQEILRVLPGAAVAVNLETTGLLKSVRFPFRSARVSNFTSARPPRSLARSACAAPFVEQAKLHSAGGCNFAARILQTGMRFDLHQDGAEGGGLQQVVKYERRIVRFKRHLCLSIKFTRLSFQHCAACHFASPIIVSYSRSGVSLRFHPLASCSRRSRRRPARAARLASSRPSRSLPCGRACSCIPASLGTHEYR